ncbi:hypothetical protein MKX03_021235 [Papaver bracteatum]|nr:hypothetical protein MKX03_021235 [Papaver bracteatum]
MKTFHKLTYKYEDRTHIWKTKCDTLIHLYHNFITEFEIKINLLKLASTIGYLEGIIEKLRATRETHTEEPVLYTKMQIANLLDDGNTTLDSMSDMDPSVYAINYLVSSQYHKSRQYSLFSIHSRGVPLNIQSVNDLSLLLLGDNIYNFGELLAHPIYLLQAINSGDLVLHQEFCVVHKAALSAQPVLVQNKNKLLEKINILCLMEIIFSCPVEDRTIPLSIIAERTKLSMEDVELLLMKCLSLLQRNNLVVASIGAMLSWVGSLYVLRRRKRWLRLQYFFILS